MLTIRELQNQLIGELQGDVVIYDNDDFDFVMPLYELPSTSPIMDRPIKYMYADMVLGKSSLGDKVGNPVLFIEVDGDYE